ncbi:hypothetical protein GCM10027578_31350 [Spirosoma luteolum]|jgi:hypothetical protein
MKKTYLMLPVLMVALAACSKSNDVAPDAGTRVAGDYPMTFIRLDSAGVLLDSLTLPYKVGGQTVVSGLIRATRISEQVDSLTVTLSQAGSTDDVLPLGRVDVTANGTGYDFYVQTLKVGSSDGTTISIDTDPTQQSLYRYYFKGKK